MRSAPTSGDGSSSDTFLGNIERDAKKILKEYKERRVKSLTDGTGVTLNPKAHVEQINCNGLSEEKRRRLTAAARKHPSAASKAANQASTTKLSSVEIMELSRRAVRRIDQTDRRPSVPLSMTSGTAGTVPASSPLAKSPFNAPPRTKHGSTKSGHRSVRRSPAKTSERPILSKQVWRDSLQGLPSSPDDGISLDKVDMSIEGLRKKYRCEQNRTEAYEAYLKQKELDALVYGNGEDNTPTNTTLPVERHPIQNAIIMCIKEENRRARESFAQKLKSEIWQQEALRQGTEELAELEKRRQASMVESEREQLQVPESFLHFCSRQGKIKKEREKKGTALKIKLVVPARNPFPSITMKLAAADLLDLPSLIPGCTSLGPHTIGPQRPLTAVRLPPADKAQSVIRFTKTTSTNPFPSIKATVAHAFTTPIYSEPLIAWDSTQILPKTSRHEEPSGIVPHICAPSESLLEEPLQSPLADRFPSPVVILDPSATEDDWKSAIPGSKYKDMTISHSRNLNENLSDGFRVKIDADRMDTQGTHAPHSFGIRQSAVSLNSPSVMEYTERVPQEMISNLLSEPKSPRDYQYIAQSPFSDRDGGSSPDGTFFTVRMKGYEIDSVVRITKGRQEREQAELQKAQENNIAKTDLETKSHATGSKLLPQPDHGADLFDLNTYKIQMTKIHTKSCSAMFNIPHKPSIVGMADRVKHVVDDHIFQTDLTTQFITNVSADRFKLFEGRREQKKKGVAILNSSQHFDLEKILKLPLNDEQESKTEEGGCKRVPTASKRSKGVTKNQIPKMEGKSQTDLAKVAIDAVKSSNFANLEYILDDLSINVNSRDEHGNSLLILAAQRSSKRMIKFLLRRNANINAQNFAGYSSLHYLYEYGHDRLAEYLVSKGARDDIFSRDGLSVYEGVAKW